MSCIDCGCRAHGRRCRDCERDRRWEDSVDQPASSTSDADADTDEFECTDCGTEYETDGTQACPACGSQSRRYIGALPGEA